MALPHRGYLFEDGGLTAIHIGKRASFAAAFSDFIRKQREGRCEVYWGHHSCDLTPSEETHHHICACGAEPKDWTVLYGKGLTHAEKWNRNKQIVELKLMEKILARLDEFDSQGNYRG